MDEEKVLSCNESEWETEDEEFIRLKIENICQIKQKFNTFGKTKLMKVKKMDKENYKRVMKCNQFLNDAIFPNIRILQPPAYKEECCLETNIDMEEKNSYESIHFNIKKYEF